MPFRFVWRDAEQTAMQYIADGLWDWRDYHACARASTFSMHRHPHPVDAVIDLRGGRRERLPGGATAHVRSFGKRLSPALSGRVIVIGCPASDREALGVTAEGTLPVVDGVAYFVDDDAQADALLARWRSEET